MRCRQLWASVASWRVISLRDVAGTGGDGYQGAPGQAVGEELHRLRHDQVPGGHRPVTSGVGSPAPLGWISSPPSVFSTGRRPGQVRCAVARSRSSKWP